MLTKIILVVAVFILVSVIFFVFGWHFIPYPQKPHKYNPVICYSPNHEYYIKRYQTFLDSLYNDYGTVIVYDKEGNKINQGTAYLAASSILWSPSYGGDVGIGASGSDWYTRLPSLPVKVNNTEDDYAQGCY